jgi:hypothetical protein
VAAFNSPRIHATHVPVEEPSTASLPDSCSAAKSRRLSCVGEIGGHCFLRSVDNPWVVES